MNDSTGCSYVQYLTFTLAEEVFALEIEHIREVLDFTTVTRVPTAPEFMRGVINLRGSVVSVLDMRKKFGIPAAEPGVNTCIIIAEVTIDGERTVIGAIADSVREVLELEREQIEPAPRIGTRLNVDFIRGMAKCGDQLIIILNIDKVFSFSELAIALESTHATEGLPATD